MVFLALSSSSCPFGNSRKTPLPIVRLLPLFPSAAICQWWWRDNSRCRISQSPDERERGVTSYRGQGRQRWGQVGSCICIWECDFGIFAFPISWWDRERKSVTSYRGHSRQRRGQGFKWSSTMQRPSRDQSLDEVCPSRRALPKLSSPGARMQPFFWVGGKETRLSRDDLQRVRFLFSDLFPPFSPHQCQCLHCPQPTPVTSIARWPERPEMPNT